MKKSEQTEEKEIKQKHEAITTVIENLLNKISLEYQIGHFGTGTFETQDYQIVYLEAGPEVLLLCVCIPDQFPNLNNPRFILIKNSHKNKDENKIL